MGKYLSIYVMKVTNKLFLYFGNNYIFGKPDISQDMAISTGGMVFGEEGSDLKLEDVQINDFGKVNCLCLLKSFLMDITRMMT